MNFKTWISSEVLDWGPGEDIEVTIDAEYCDGKVKAGTVRAYFRGAVEITNALTESELSILTSYAGEQLMREKAGA